MGRPACANPANIQHIVKPSSEGGGKTWCYQECVCGEIVSGLQCSPEVHPMEPNGQCGCEVTPAHCIDCDAEFTPTEADQGQCTSCVARESA